MPMQEYNYCPITIHNLIHLLFLSTQLEVKKISLNQ